MRRHTLSLIVRAMFGMLFIAFMAVLFASLDTRDKLSPSQTTEQQTELFADILPGQTQLRRVGRQRVWVTRLDPALISQLTALQAHLLDAQAGCAVDQPICVLDARSVRDGIELVYSKQAPTSLPANVPWRSGFVDPADGSAFDLLGRGFLGTTQRQALTQISLPE